MWLKVWRDSSAMAGRLHYAEYENEDQMKSILEYYDDKIFGDGYHDLKWEEIDNPPKEWLEKEIKKCTEISKRLYKNYRRNKIAIEETIKRYKSIL